MVQNLHNNLIIAPELADMRRRLKNLESKDGQVLFVSLYNCWSHNAVSTFSLCLLAQAYEHASNLLQTLYISIFIWEIDCSGDLEITVPFLIQVDKLVQILESPVFTCTFPRMLIIDLYRSSVTITRTRETSLSIQMSLWPLNAPPPILCIRYPSQSIK